MNTEFSASIFPSLFDNFLLPVFVSDWKNKIFETKSLTVKVLRLDAQHPHIGGNKLYKLYYNLVEAKKQNKKQLLTFGGAYSNHLRATAFAANQLGLKSIGIIRGEEQKTLNPVLTFCKKQNMHLHYVSRTEYREKNTNAFIEKIHQKFDDFYFIPEGGSNSLAIKGTSHIAQTAFDLIPSTIDYFALAIGTGGTTAGILNGIQETKSKVLAVSALKGGEFLREDIKKMLTNFYKNTTQNTEKNLSNLILETNFHEGGYAKKSERLQHFIEEFNQNNDFKIEPIYTGKVFFAVEELARNNFFEEGTTIVLIHTGGIF